MHGVGAQFGKFISMLEFRAYRMTLWMVEEAAAAMNKVQGEPPPINSRCENGYG